MSFPNASAELDLSRLRVSQLEGILRKLQEAPMPCATVVEVSGTKTTIVSGAGLLEVATPTQLKVKPGNRVHVDPQTNGIIDIVANPFTVGNLRKVTRIVDERHCEIGNHGESHLVLYAGDPPKPDDRVILDPLGFIIVRNLGKAEPPPGPTISVEVSWDDIGGQAEAKRELIEAIEGPIRDKELYARYGARRVKGALLCGPAGNGKTLLGKAAATAQARMHGHESASTGFIYVKGPELLNPLIGKSEEGVRKLFADARAHAKEKGYPAIIFLDEADALLMKRGNPRFEGMERTIVPMFLAEMDGMEDSGAFVIVATNRPDQIDSAITREERLDLKIMVRRPTRPDAVDILRRRLQGRPLEGQTLDEAAEAAATHLFAERHTLAMIRMKTGSDKRFTLGHVVSGAMCGGLIEKATTLAMRRARETGETGERGGIVADDFVRGATAICEEQKILDHSAEIEEFVEPFRTEVVRADRVKGGPS